MLNDIRELRLVDNALHPLTHAVTELCVSQDVKPVLTDGCNDVVGDFGWGDAPCQGCLDHGRERLRRRCRADFLLRTPLELREAVALRVAKPRLHAARAEDRNTNPGAAG